MGKEIFLYKVSLSATLAPLEIKMDVTKMLATERVNSYLVTAMEMENGKMQPIPENKVITKANIMDINPRFAFASTYYSIVCFENQLSEAKGLLIDQMETALHADIENAIAMKETFEEYKSNIK